jgi:putative transposase
MTKLTIKAKITDDSKTKLSLIESEYNNYQTYLQSKCNQIINLYSATKQQAQRVLKRIQSRGELNPKKQYPLVLRRDLIDIRKDSKFPCVYWMRIPVYPKSINVRIQTSCDYDLTAKEYLLRESKIVNKNKDWYVFITIEKETTALLQEQQQPTNVLAIDLGCKNIAVTVNTANTRPNFYGKDLRQIWGFHFWLRRKLGQKKAFYKIKDLKDREFLQVNHELHTISKSIVEEAKRTNAIIVFGKLKGIRQSIKAGRRVRRLINNFPYYRLIQYIKYKAEWIGVKVKEISEAYTSQTCFNCHKRDKMARKTQGLYECSNCNVVKTNADYNGAMNILQRALGILSNVGGFLTYPRLSVIVERGEMITKEPHMP